MRAWLAACETGTELLHVRLMLVTQTSLFRRGGLGVAICEVNIATALLVRGRIGVNINKRTTALFYNHVTTVSKLVKWYFKIIFFLLYLYPRSDLDL